MMTCCVCWSSLLIIVNGAGSREPAHAGRNASSAATSQRNTLQGNNRSNLRNNAATDSESRQGFGITGDSKVAETLDDIS